MKNYRLISNPAGPTLGTNTTSEINILQIDGLFFKDLNNNGILDPYEDWRLPAAERARDLAKRMSVEQIAGLMLYSSHQSIPDREMSFFNKATYNGQPFSKSGAAPDELSDQQKAFLTQDQVRHVLATIYKDASTAALWNNRMQALCEAMGLGILVNTSSDPRHGSDFTAEFNMGSGSFVSHWPETLGLAATFDPDLVREFGKIASLEYRALGIGTALSPQIDIATEPRWNRFSGTFGESPELSRDMARAYCEGFQTSEGDKEIDGGWGYESVNAMVKHWPGGGSGEAGRDAHFGFGKYAVYPGGCFEQHLTPFTEGAFQLHTTQSASAVMPYYTISDGKDSVGNAYSKKLIQDLLRGTYGYDGVVCTDWGITKDISDDISQFTGKCWGMEGISVAQRHYMALMAGVDQFGGNNEVQPVLEAYAMGVAEHGEGFMRKRFEQSACRLLLNSFRLGLFENPYLDPQTTVQTVGCKTFVDCGKRAQEKSVILLKNQNNVLPIRGKQKVYIPKRFIPKTMSFFGAPTQERWEDALPMDEVKKYYDVTDAESADFALVVITSPNSTSGYDKADREAGGNGYVPISLQYRPYTATAARERSIAGGDPLEDFTDRSYRGKTVTTSNERDLDCVLETKKAMGDKPVIVVLRLNRPTVVGELEPAADAILAHSGIEAEALLRILSGAVEPSGLLPMQLPADMTTVEEQCEDAPFDMKVHVDTQGHGYDFGFGLNWAGVIEDERVRKYKRR